MQPTRLAQVAAYQSPWLKAEDLQGRAAAVVVEAATVEEIRQPDGKKEGRVVVAFRGKAKKLILNKTQAEALVALAKSDVFADWVGLSLTLEPATASNRKPTIVVKAGAARQSASSEDNPFGGEN